VTPAPVATLVLKSPGDVVTATLASPMFEIPFAELVPIALDEQLATTGTPSDSLFFN
jgi:hypothetical protein